MEEFILKENPRFKISILKDSFEIYDSGNKNQGFFFKEVDSLRIGKRINWLVTIFSFLMNFFITSSGDVYKERDQLKFNYQKKPINISLKGCDIDSATKAVNKINEEIRRNS